MELRESRHWTQGQLAYHSGVDQATISRIEAGSAKQIWLSTVERLADTLGVSIDFLRGKTSEPVEPSDLSGIDLSDPNIRLVLQKLSELPSEDRRLIAEMIMPYIRRAEEFKREREERRRRRQQGEG